jgi:putative hydrolase of the HAD superfamily
VRALILDYGEVLSLPQSPELTEAMAATLGVPRDTFEAAYWRHRRAYDLGLPVTDYWTMTLADLGITAVSSIPALVELDIRSWTRYREPMWTAAAAARAAGVKTAILSNGVPEIMERVRLERMLGATFDVVVVSCEVGCAKPDPEIYRLTLSQLDAAPEHAVFVDDRTENIDAARQLGLRTVHFSGEERMAEFQARLTEELSL